MFEASRPERRRAPRRRVLKGGRLVFNNRRSTIDCIVRNLSPLGALLALPSTIDIPDEVEVWIGGEIRPARIIWKTDDKLGVVWV